jgi:hypothetical protein
MNLMEMIRSLHCEKEIVDRAIASLEEFQRNSKSLPHSSGKRRGGSISANVPARFSPDKEVSGSKVRRRVRRRPANPMYL